MPSPITVNVNFIDLAGNAVSGYMEAAIVPPTGVFDLYVTGTGIIVPKTTTSTTGTSVSVIIWGNDVVVDAADGALDTYYTVNLFNTSNVLIWSAAYLFTGTGPINLVGFPSLSTVPSATGPVPTNILTGNNVFTGNNSFSGTNSFTGFTTLSTASIGTTSVKSLNTIQYADQFAGADWGLQIQNAVNALLLVSSTGGVVDARGINSPSTTASVDPLVGITVPVTILLGTGVYNTNVGLTLPANGQRYIGNGARDTRVTAGASFPSATSLFTIGGAGVVVFSSYITGMSVNANGKTTSTALTLIGVQEGCVSHDVVLEGATSQVVLFSGTIVGGLGTQNTGLERFEVTTSGGTAPGIVLQAGVSGRIWLRDATISGTSLSSGDGIQYDSTTGHLLCQNLHFEQHTVGIHKTAAGFLTAINCDGHSTVTDVVHINTATTSYELVSISPGSPAATNSLVDVNRTYTLTGYIDFIANTGVSSPYIWGTGIPWTVANQLVLQPPIGVAALQVLLTSGFTGSNAGFIVLDNASHTQFNATNDGRVQFRGNQSGAFIQTMSSDVLTAGRAVTFPNGPSAPVLVASLVTTAATTDNVTIQGMTAGGHVMITPTNAAAATNVATTYVSAKAANQITITHVATANMNYDIFATSI